MTLLSSSKYTSSAGVSWHIDDSTNMKHICSCSVAGKRQLYKFVKSNGMNSTERQSGNCHYDTLLSPRLNRILMRRATLSSEMDSITAPTCLAELQCPQWPECNSCNSPLQCFLNWQPTRAHRVIGKFAFHSIIGTDSLCDSWCLDWKYNEILREQKNFFSNAPAPFCSSK